jgi:hypothetical protein
MRALILDCTPANVDEADVEVATRTMDEALADRDIEVETLRIHDYDLQLPEPDTSTDKRWTDLRAKVLEAEILLLASPASWLGEPPDEARVVLEGLDTMLAPETRGGSSATNHVAGVVVSGDSEGGKLVLNEVTAALTRLGFTVPGRAATYLNAEALRDAPPAVRDSFRRPGDDAAANLVAVAKALEANPMPTEPDEGPGDGIRQIAAPESAVTKSLKALAGQSRPAAASA